MKRDSDGLVRDEAGRICFEEYVDHSDLGDKMTCLMEFATQWCSAEKFKDSFLMFSHSSDDQPQKDVIMCWYTRHFHPSHQAPAGKEDTRDHEAMLYEHFKKYSLSIEKLPCHWRVVISTPTHGRKASKRVTREPEKK